MDAHERCQNKDELLKKEEKVIFEWNLLGFRKKFCSFLVGLAEHARDWFICV